MKINLRFFAGVREAVGMAADTVELPDEAATAGAVRALLIARGGAWADALGQARALRMAFNQRMCGPEAALADGGELAFFPPVTGG